MPRNVNNGDSLCLPSQKCSFQPGSALIVEEVLIPMFFHQFRNDYGDLAVRILPLKIQNVLHDRTDDEAIRRIQKSYLRNSQPGSSQRLCNDLIPLPEKFLLIDSALHMYDLHVG